MDEGVRTYFNRVPLEWDALYSPNNRLRYLYNRLFRKALFERHNLTFDRCGDVVGADVLDIGCGTGQYSVEFALRGAGRVVGIDFAPAMIDFARQMADQKGLSETCRFVCGDFQSYSPEEAFDIVIAVGFFDYIAHPQPILSKIARLTRKTFLASFPRSSPLWRMQRTIRYTWIKRCPIYEYSRQQIEALYQESGFSSFHVIPLTHGFFVTAKAE